MAAGLATLAEIRERALSARAERLGERLLELTRPLVGRYDVVKEVRGLGLLWAIEFGQPDHARRTWQLLERSQPALFSQFVVGPLFRRHHILSQVAGHSLNVIKGLPPLVIDERDLEWFAAALDETVADARRLRRAAAGFALRAAAAHRHAA
jgi:ornithine--oxo-acid transaminase